MKSHSAARLLRTASHIDRSKFTYEHTLLYLLSREEHKHLQSCDALISVTLTIYAFSTHSLTHTHRSQLSWTITMQTNTYTHTRCYFLGQIFRLLHFSFSGKKNIFVRKHSNCESPDLGSIFLIEEEKTKREVDTNEDRLLEGDQS